MIIIQKKKLRPIYELFPSCLYKHIKSEDDILNLVKKARKIGSFLNFGALRKKYFKLNK